METLSERTTDNPTRFMETFSCVGAACREHCCQGVSITLDKTVIRDTSKAPTPILSVSP